MTRDVLATHIHRERIPNSSVVLVGPRLSGRRNYLSLQDLWRDQRMLILEAVFSGVLMYGASRVCQDILNFEYSSPHSPARIMGRAPSLIR